jgi:hypothetical protein
MDKSQALIAQFRTTIVLLVHGEMNLKEYDRICGKWSKCYAISVEYNTKA